MKLFLVNGQQGSGKTSVSKLLLRKIKNSAYFGTDALVATNPWEFGGKTDELAIANAVSLINNFSKFGFENIIICGLTRNQNILDKFLAEFQQQPEMMFIWLRADNKTRMLRKEKRSRDEADERKHFDFVDSLIPDINSIEVKNGTAIFIDSSIKSIEEIALEIVQNLS